MQRQNAIKGLAGAVTVVFLAAFGGVAGLPAAAPGADGSTDQLARQILDGSKPNPEREAIIKAHPELSAELIMAMTRDLGSDQKEEYKRIPWIWRVAVAAGRRNESAEVGRLLDLALPREGSALGHWQAVVIGGGLINGISLQGVWPAERIEGLLRDQASLKARWSLAIEQAATMADDESVPTGTRYDALRILGVDTWDRRGAQLFRYLVKGVHPELQQGAISALANVRSPAVGQALLSGFEHYSEGNRKFVLAALLRDNTRREALLDAVASGRLERARLGDETIRKLTDPSEGGPHERARKIFAPGK